MEAHLREQPLAGTSLPSDEGPVGGGLGGGGPVGGSLVDGDSVGGGLVHVVQVFQALGVVAPLAQDVVVAALRVVLQEEETHQNCGDATGLSW